MPATIYFSGSITGGRQDVALYRQIVEALETDGHNVLAGAVAAEHVGAAGESIGPREIFERDVAWMHEAQLLVAEVSVPSLGVGYEVAYARHRLGIPVICLYRQGISRRCSAMIAGDSGIELIEYQETGELLPVLLESIRKAVRSSDRLS